MASVLDSAMNLSDLISSISMMLPTKIEEKNEKNDKNEKNNSIVNKIEFPPEKCAIVATQQPFEFDVHSTISNCAKRLKKFADIYKENLNIYELETRLFMRSNAIGQHLSPSIPETLFNQILSFYTRNVKHFQFTPWYYTFDSIYENDIRLRKTWSSKNPKPTFEWVQKKIIENSNWHIDGRPLSMRVSLKIEKKVDPLTSKGSIPAITYMQTKQTCCFKDTMFSIYFSSIWKGSSEYEMQVAKPIFSIEVEVDSLSNLLVNNLSTSTEIISNLIIRTLELQGLNSPLSLVEQGTYGSF